MSTTTTAVTSAAAAAAEHFSVQLICKRLVEKGCYTIFFCYLCRSLRANIRTLFCEAFLNL